MVTVVSLTTGRFNVLCKIRAKEIKQAKNIIFTINNIDGVYQIETMISMEEFLNDKTRLMKEIFKNLDQ